MSDFTHFNKQGEAVMVDVSEKKDTVREAQRPDGYGCRKSVT